MLHTFGAVGGSAAGLLQLALFAVFAAVITASVAGVVGIVSKGGAPHKYASKPGCM